MEPKDKQFTIWDVMNGVSEEDVQQEETPTPAIDTGEIVINDFMQLERIEAVVVTDNLEERIRDIATEQFNRYVETLSSAIANAGVSAELLQEALTRWNQENT